jgi:AcrR family transcriptional regulator
MVPARDTYHHGDLHRALVDAGLDLARVGGAKSVVLREATRRTGVTARAAYRHFADREALVRAVARAALDHMGTAILAGQTGVTDPVDLLREVGRGYIAFALDEPGWFDVAFFAVREFVGSGSGTGSGIGSDTGIGSGVGPVAPPAGAEAAPSRLLRSALDALVDAGMLGPERVLPAASMCWSGVHGFATLATRGPLAGLPRSALDAQADRLVDDLVAGVTR